MRHYNIINALEVKCPFPEVFEEKEAPEGYGARYPRKIVHIRADYDGHRWWNTVWPCHDELATAEMRREVDAVYALLTSDKAFADLGALRSFCHEFPQAKPNESSDSEYNFYMEGALCWYWLRCITRSKDYNLYLHAFLKNEDPVQPYFMFLDGVSKPDLTSLTEAYPDLSEEHASSILWRWTKRFKEGR